MMLEELCKCEWIKSPMKPWVVIHGATGCGKSYIASLLAYQDCMHGYTVSYYNMALLITEIDSAKANNKVSNLRNSLLNKQWHGQFSDPIKADAVMDRVINQSCIIGLSGKSMREKYGAMAQIRQEAEHAKNS